MSTVEAAREWEVAFGFESTEVRSVAEAYRWLCRTLCGAALRGAERLLLQVIFASTWPRDIFEANCEDVQAFAMFIEAVAWSRDV